MKNGSAFLLYPFFGVIVGVLASSGLLKILEELPDWIPSLNPAYVVFAGVFLGGAAGVVSLLLKDP